MSKKEMYILNIGHNIKKGKYNLHSKFKNVFNYSIDRDIVSLVSSEVGSGPNNIVLSKFPEFAKKTMTISNNKLIIGNTALQIDFSEPQTVENIFLNNRSDLLKKIEILIDNISDKISTKSLGFLLFPENEVFFKTAFEKAFLNHVKKTITNIFLEKLPVITKKMKGTGFGLTPSGDDFNCGVLYALNYLNRHSRSTPMHMSVPDSGAELKLEVASGDLSEIIEECYSNSVGNNLISNTFLKYAYLNLYYENFYELLKALKQNNTKNISYYAEKVINSGHTSGSDMITGFILTIKGVLNDQKSG
jgi:hypothetical protein